MAAVGYRSILSLVLLKNYPGTILSWCLRSRAFKLTFLTPAGERGELSAPFPTPRWFSEGF